MTPFLERLIAGGPGYIANQTEGCISLRPAGDTVDALEAFQPTVDRVFENEGDGYSICGEPHQSSEYPIDYYDLIVLSFEK